jgi:hypothetical protein
MNVWIQRQTTEDWAVWMGDPNDPYQSEDFKLFKPKDGGYYLDAYSYGFYLAQRDGVGFRELPQPK